MPHSPDGIARRAAPPAPRIALVSDRLDWHARELVKALAAAGARATLVRLEDCRFETDHPHGLHMPGFDERLPDAVFVRCLSGGSFEAVTVRLGILHALARERRPGDQRRARDRTLRRQIDDELPPGACRYPQPGPPGSPSNLPRHAALSSVEVAKGPLVLKPLVRVAGAQPAPDRQSR